MRPVIRYSEAFKLQVIREGFETNPVPSYGFSWRRRSPLRVRMSMLSPQKTGQLRNSGSLLRVSSS